MEVTICNRLIINRYVIQTFHFRNRCCAFIKNKRYYREPVDLNIRTLNLLLMNDRPQKKRRFDAREFFISPDRPDIEFLRISSTILYKWPGEITRFPILPAISKPKQRR